MSALIVTLRLFALLVFVGSIMLLRQRRGHGGKGAQTSATGNSRVPVLANFFAFGAFYSSLVFYSKSSDDLLALVVAFLGSLLAAAGAGLVFRSRSELGSAWSLVPRAGQNAGLVTTGPYRIVRHPIYLGFIVLVTGQAIAFESYPSLAVVALCVTPSLAWRAYLEDRALLRTFDKRYVAYRQRTKMIIPFTF